MTKDDAVSISSSFVFPETATPAESGVSSETPARVISNVRYSWLTRTASLHVVVVVVVRRICVKKTQRPLRF